MKKYFLFLIGALLFFLMAIFWSYFQKKNISEESVVSDVAAKISSEVVSLKQEAAQLFKQPWDGLNHTFFMVENNQFKKWNSVTPFIEIADVQDNFEWKFFHNSINDFLIYKSSVSDSSFVVGLIQLRAGYRLTNQYLTSNLNTNIFSVKDIKLLPTDSSEGSLVCIEGAGCLFRIQIGSQIRVNNLVSVYLLSIATILSLFFIFYLTRDFNSRRKYLQGFFLHLISLSALRMAMVTFSFPSIWVYSKYFDPRFFASSSFNASAGDFFFNSLIVAIVSIYFLFVFTKLQVVRAMLRAPMKNKFIITIILLTLSFFCFLFPHLFIEAIHHDSSIVVDISTSVAFDGVKLFALGAFLLGCISSFCFVHILLRISISLTRLSRWPILLAGSSILFIGYFLFSELDYWAVLIFGAIYFLSWAFLKHYKGLQKFGNGMFVYVLAATMLYSAMAAWDVKKFSDERTSKALLRSATRLVGNDELGEYLLDQARVKISKDLFIISGIQNPLLSKKGIKQKITQFYLGEYFERYEIGINFFHADGSPMVHESTMDFATSIKSIQSGANKTSYESIYWILSDNPRSLKRYVLIVPLIKSSTFQGYVVLDLNLKRIFSDRVYPELLSDTRFIHAQPGRNFSYALFENEVILDQRGSVDFNHKFDSEWFKQPIIFSKGLKKGNLLFAGAEDESGRRIVLAAEESSVFSLLSNFAFFFLLGIALLFFVLIFGFIKSWFNHKSMTFAVRLRLFYYLSLIVPVVAVSFIAVRLIVNSNNKQAEREIETKGQAIAENLTEVLEKTETESPFKSRNVISEVTEIANVDANLYSPDGRLINSTQPLIFSNQLLMPLINPKVLSSWSSGNFSDLKLINKVGQLEYNSSYISIRSLTTGKLLGILELPFFNPQNEAARASLVSNILVTFALVFLFFSFFAFKIVNGLTAPLSFLAKKLSETSLTGAQAMKWKSNDEIGELVKHYNKMLDNLERSKRELARQEKESAWREIAKQVAHEIKNPLTPMKLTLQQLEQTMVRGDMSNERTASAIRTLLSQVEILNEIAGSFSTFADMPKPEMRRIDLRELLRNAVLLFENHPLGKVKLVEHGHVIFVNADEKLLGRIISNIILNGLQSDTEKRVEVEVQLRDDDDDFVEALVKDNGRGISSELRDKIFLPHFSTKKTGSGLGLAIAKQGIEQMEGTLNFESTQGVGSCFSILLRKA